MKLSCLGRAKYYNNWKRNKINKILEISALFLLLSVNHEEKCKSVISLKLF